MAYEELYPAQLVMDGAPEQIKLILVEDTAAKVNVATVGIQGPPGLSAYEIAKRHGYEGTEEEWEADRSVTRAQQFAQDAQDSADAAAVSEANAENSAQAAAGSALEAEGFANDAADSALLAENHATNAGYAKADAEAAQSAAEAAALAASGSASAASGSASAASGFADDAADSASAALNSANAAANSASDALGYKEDAEDAALAAANSASTASGYASAADSSALAAAGSASAASGYASAASVSAQDALDAADLAEKWATEDEDTEVVTGRYSALHHAAKAAASALAAAGSASDANDAREAAEDAAEDAETLFETFRTAYYGAFASPPSLNPFGDPPAEGDMYYDTTGKILMVYDETLEDWKAAGNILNGVMNVKRWTGVQGETVFDIVHNPGFLMVHLNGVLLTPGVDYTDTDAGGFTLTVPVASNGDEITALGFGAMATMPLGDLALLDKDSLRGFRNKIINGDFSHWQRGTSFNGSGFAATYTADRWYVNPSGSTWNVSRQQHLPGGPADLPDGLTRPGYALRLEVTGADDNVGISTKLEGVRSGTYTLSGWIKVGSDDTPTGSVNVTIRQNFGSGGSELVAVSRSVTFTGKLSPTGWFRLEEVFELPSIAGKTFGTGHFTEILIVNPANETFVWWFAQMQFEEGEIVTPFEERPLALELALCQRYYWRVTPGNTQRPFSGRINSTTMSILPVNLPVPMRVAPTVIVSNYADWTVADSSSSEHAVTNITWSGEGTSGVGQINVSGSGLASGSASQLRAASADAWIAFDAEL